MAEVVVVGPQSQKLSWGVCVCGGRDAECAEREKNGRTQICLFLPSVMWEVAALPTWPL